MTDNNLNIFKSKIQSRVKFHEVDLFNIVHNIQYFYWLEWARTEYIRKVGVSANVSDFLMKFNVMVVHSEIDYFAAAGFDDEYEILTRLTFIKNSSVGFENIIQLKNGTILAKAKAVLVHFDVKTKNPVRVPDEIRSIFKSFEKENLILAD